MRRLALGVAVTAVLQFAGAVAIAISLDHWANVLSPDLAVALGFPLVGALLVQRRVGGSLGPVMCFGALCSAFVVFAGAYVALPSAPGETVVGWLAEFTWVPSVALIGPTVLLLPDGHLPSPRWRWLPWVAGGIGTFCTVVDAMHDGDLSTMPGTPAPFGVIPLDVTNLIGPPLFLTLLGLSLVALVATVQRWRRSVGTERLQLGWIGLTCGIAVATIAATSSSDGGIAAALQVTAPLLIPAGIGVAVVRYRLYDLGRVVSRTVTYGLLTALLVGVYVGLVAATSALLPDYGNVGVVLSTLAVAALFVPVRRTIQRTVDRRFNRARYDASRTVEAFAARLRTQVDPSVLHADLLDVLARTVAPAHATLWVAR